ncbi:MAG: alpha/beta fold hydrolase [Maritimibacter sp.]
MTRRSEFMAVLGHELHVSLWGDPINPAVVMWHGLARTGRDFDELARALSDQYFVLCPDTIGRGLSSWSDDSTREYLPRFYARLALAMLDHYEIACTHWIGTSMGGLIGMHLAASKDAKRLSSLIINDIGPELPDAALDRITTYVAELPRFDSYAEGELWLREIYAPFGPAPAAFWQRMALTSFRRCADGKLTLHYDPKIADMLRDDEDQALLWQAWDRTTTPCHILRGAESDILPASLAHVMTQRGARPALTTIERCGHAPSLSRVEDAELVRSLLRRLS